MRHYPILMEIISRNRVVPQQALLEIMDGDFLKLP